MKLTSKEANKYLKQFNDELDSLLKKDSYSRSFVASISEDEEKLRPEYDFKEMKKELREIQNKIITLKHAINVFNVNTVIEEYDMTIDEMLIYIPQLTKEKQRLALMKDMPKQERIQDYRRSNIIDYCYRNFDEKEVAFAYNVISSDLARAQKALDTVNITETFEVDI